MSGSPNTVREPEARIDRRRARHEATRAEIVEAAWEMARRLGLAGISLRELAAAVGMTAPSLYSYFGSKNDIYDAMYRQGYEAFGAHMAAHTPDSDDLVELGTASALAFMDFATADPARFQLLFLRTIPGFEPSPESWEVAVDVHRRGAEALIGRGVVDAAAMDLWTAVLTGMASQQLSNDPGGTRWRDLVPRAVAALVAESKAHTDRRRSTRRS